MQFVTNKIQTSSPLLTVNQDVKNNNKAIFIS